jgi:hypothetical protein
VQRRPVVNPRQARDILDKVVANVQHVILGKEIPSGRL